MNVVPWMRGLALLSMLALGSEAAADSDQNSLVAHVRAANGRFEDVSVAVSEGYVPVSCASIANGAAMDVRYLNEKYLSDAVPDVARPQALVYELTAEGNLALAAVDYITSKGPTAMDGQSFRQVDAPNRYGPAPVYELHVWAWKANPRGAFAGMDAEVSCGRSAPPASGQIHDID